MKVGDNLPIVSQPRQSPKTTLPAALPAGDRQSNMQVPSSVQRFESYAQAESSRFSKIEGLSAFAQEALSAYQATESLASSNPRNLLIGVDVYA